MSDQPTLDDRCDLLLNVPEDRRAHVRLPVKCRILLTPVDERDAILIEENVSTFGEDVSSSGVRFVHTFPLAQPRFLLSFRDAELGDFVVEAEVVWTRTAISGRHETGCRIIRKMIAPPRFA